jgi:preprotein translocase subunit SecD
LFVQKGEHIWGTFDEMANKLVIHETQQNGDECLLNTAVIKTILTGGDVHILEKEKMPAASQIAAVLRY